jgi:hypothetical protein
MEATGSVSSNVSAMDLSTSDLRLWFVIYVPWASGYILIQFRIKKTVPKDDKGSEFGGQHGDICPGLLR